MSDHRPPACHYDRDLNARVVIGEHRDDCTTPDTHRGCVPCTAPHCVVCGRNHANNDHPVTCPTCVGRIRDDLTAIGADYDDLAIEAIDGGSDGRLVAAAPIPGGTAQVLRGPTVGYQDLVYSPDLIAFHPVSDRTGQPLDPIPPLAVLAVWEDRYRTWLGHDPHTRATLHGAIAYLVDQLPHIAQAHGGPDWQAFADEARDLRAHLEAALHDDREPERGVACFECPNGILIRRWHPATRCTHSTPARREFRRWLQLGYPEALTAADARAARRPCGRPDCDQGGITDPSAGQSWECRDCRKAYDPGEYAHAVRRDLLTGGPDRDGWTHIAMAAEAVTMMTGQTFGPDRIRRWMDRIQVSAVCRWRAEVRGGELVSVQNGLRLVLWTDVRDRAEESIRRARELELERQHVALQGARLREAVDAGEPAAEAGKRLGIHPARVAKFLDLWEAQARMEARNQAHTERLHRAG